MSGLRARPVAGMGAGRVGRPKDPCRGPSALWKAARGDSDSVLCFPTPSHSFIAHAIRHCYQPVGGGGSPSDFYLCSLLASGTAALACVFLGVTVDRFGRRGILLLSMTLTGIASLVLLGLWDCEHPTFPTVWAQQGIPNRGASDRLSHFFWHKPPKTSPRPCPALPHASTRPYSPICSPSQLLNAQSLPS